MSTLRALAPPVFETVNSTSCSQSLRTYLPFVFVTAHAASPSLNKCLPVVVAQFLGESSKDADSEAKVGKALPLYTGRCSYVGSATQHHHTRK